MTAEQKTEMKRIGGILEECVADLKSINKQIESESYTTVEEPDDGIDLNYLIGEIEDLYTAIDDGADKVFERMELV